MTTKDAIKYFESYIESTKEDGMGIPSEEPFRIAIEALQEKQHNDELRQKGRLVELPCAVGSTVWDTEGLCRRPSPYTVTGFSLGEMMDNECAGDMPKDEIAVHCVARGGGITECFPASEIGKAVFTTKKAAQDALDEKWE